MSRLRTLGPRAALAAIGVLLGASGTALAVSGQRASGSGVHGGPGSSSLTSRHEVYSPPGGNSGDSGDSGGSGGSGGGSNRNCVYLTNRDCVYPSTYSLGSAGARRFSALVPVTCVGPSKCRVRLLLTVEEKLRGGSVRAIAAAAHAPGARADRAGERAEAARRHRRHLRHRRNRDHGRGSHGHHGVKPRLDTRVVTVADRTVTLAGSHHEIYRLTLNAIGRRLLRRFGVLHAKLVTRPESGITRVGRAPVTVVTFRRRH